jgi:HAMP domain-containing protein
MTSGIPSGTTGTPAANKVLHLLHSRIGRAIALTLGLGMTVIGVGGAVLLLGSLQRAHESHARHLLHTVAEALSASYATFDQRHGGHPVGEIAAALGDRGALSALEVFDADGVVRWSSVAHRAGQRVAPELLAAALGRTQTATASSTELRAVVALRKRAACRDCHADAPDPIGAVHVAADTARLDRDGARRSVRVVLGASIAIVVLTMLLLWLIDRRVVRPLDGLVRAMDEAERLNFFVRAPVGRPDEIGRLARRFNELLAKITDLRVDRIESERELSDAREAPGVRAELAERTEELTRCQARLSERVAQLALLQELARTLAESTAPETLPASLIDGLAERLEPSELALLLDVPTGGGASELRLAARRGLTDAGLPAPHEPVAPAEGSLLATALATRALVYVPDQASDRRPLVSSAPRGGGACLVVPLLHRDRAVGALVARRADVGAFPAATRSLLGTVASQAALAFAGPLARPEAEAGTAERPDEPAARSPAPPEGASAEAPPPAATEPE